MNPNSARKVLRTIVRICLVLLTPLVLQAASPEAFNVVWDSPSADYHGSMPLGNGDIGLNLWIEKNGDLQFFISKTDAWDDNARLVKVGKVRIHFDPNPFSEGQSFRQTLSLQDGTVHIRAGEGARQISVRVWVDANHPVIHITSDSASPGEATATLELWRTRPREETDLQVSDVLLNRKLPNGRQTPLVIEPDTILAGQRDRIGWFHSNAKSVGPELLAQVQGLTGFKQEDPLWHRTFGAVITTPQGQRLDDRRLRSPRAASHQYSIFVLTRHPSSPERWLADLEQVISGVEARPFTARREAHEAWWREFWNRSWIQASVRPGARFESETLPTNQHPVMVGQDQQGANKFTGELGRVSLFNRTLSEPEIRALFDRDRANRMTGVSGLVHSGNAPGPVTNSAGWDFARGFTLEAWVRPEALSAGGGRLVDKITPGGSDGFLLDTFPGNSVRFICGQTILGQQSALPAGVWSHVVAVADPAAGSFGLFLNGKRVSGNATPDIRDEAAYLSQMYHLQRFITACAGRGAYPIKFNGSIFTVPPPEGKGDPDYRRWGPGYWWQNTRLPYISLCASGDFDLQQPLFRMYAGELLEYCKYRTRRYCGHAGAFYPECIYFWGPIFSETYGWTPFEQRTDKLQESGWHKWEWVGGLELCWLLLDHYEHTLDTGFLAGTAVPFAREILTFFEQHYPTNAQGRLVMQPSQALETWWDCTDPMPEVAGCRAVVERLLALPASLAPAADRQFWQRLQAKLPPLPVRQVNGKTALAPAARFEKKSNIENPELYAVFPFRLIGVGRPNLDWGVTALQHRWDQGNFGWRQDDIFMAYLGLADQARRNVVGRARSHDPHSRFPAFWGPNYDWTPDQDHGGVLMKTVQAMLLQTDGRRIFLLPAWPSGWDVEFKLHAPYQTTIECVYREGQVQSLRVTPEARRAEVELMIPSTPGR